MIPTPINPRLLKPDLWVLWHPSGNFNEPARLAHLMGYVDTGMDEIDVWFPESADIRPQDSTLCIHFISKIVPPPAGPHHE